MMNASNNMQMERAHGSGVGNNRRVADLPSTMVKPMVISIHKMN